MNLDTFAPAEGGSLRRPVLGPHRRVVATFTPTTTPDPGDIWKPLSRTTDRTRDASQGDPLGYRPGRSIEHEPVDNAEKQSEHTAQNAYHFAETANQIRAALRPGGVG